MRDCHMGVTAFVTRDVTGESQHPVPARPNPARPALYRSAWSPEHHSVALVTRASAARVVAGPVDEMMTGLSTIEGINLDAEVKCSVKGHDHRADILVRGRCLKCPRVSPVRAVCWQAWERACRHKPTVGCHECGATNMRSREVWTIVEVLR